VKTKRVTIVHTQELLLNDAYPDYFRKDVARGLRKRDVGVILNDSITDMNISDAGIVTTVGGRRLIADLIV
jgi:apoptosis-inducing factor 2